MLSKRRSSTGRLSERARALLFYRASRMAPRITGLLAGRVFLTPMVRPHVHWQALRGRPAVKQLVGSGMYHQWGDGPPVALIHGWNGYSTQFAQFIEPILAAGLSAVAIDAPGHIASPGMRSNPRLFAETLLKTGEQLGPFAGVIGHSLGGAAVMLALREGLRMESAVCISTPHTLHSVICGFESALALSDRADTYLRRFIEGEVGEPIGALAADKMLKGFALPPALIIHDNKDGYIAASAAPEIHAVWAGSELLLTTGLGHGRILQDQGVISNAVRFIADRAFREGRGSSGGAYPSRAVSL